jgi:hypothetical protein
MPPAYKIKTAYKRPLHCRIKKITQHFGKRIRKFRIYVRRMCGMVKRNNESQVEFWVHIYSDTPPFPPKTTKNIIDV